MKLKGKLNIEHLDIKMYEGIAALASNDLKRVEDESIPTFIIEEALEYYCELEKYEICNNIKKFHENNFKHIIKSSRAEWFGLEP